MKTGHQSKIRSIPKSYNSLKKARVIGSFFISGHLKSDLSGFVWPADGLYYD